MINIARCARYQISLTSFNSIAINYLDDICINNGPYKQCRVLMDLGRHRLTDDDGLTGFSDCVFIIETI